MLSYWYSIQTIELFHLLPHLLRSQVNALVLTIPFAIIPDFNFAYWTELKDLLEQCEESGVRPFREVRFIYRASTLGERAVCCVVLFHSYCVQLSYSPPSGVLSWLVCTIYSDLDTIVPFSTGEWTVSALPFMSVSAIPPSLYCKISDGFLANVGGSRGAETLWLC